MTDPDAAARPDLGAGPDLDALGRGAGPDLDALALLVEPVRRDLYGYVAGAGHDVGRDEAARAVGVGRTLAAFHLDKLVDAGLLATVYRRVNGRGGPGAGRPAKLYRRAAGERSVSLPPRSYELAADLLADVVTGAGLEEALEAAARTAGRAAAGSDPRAALLARGYEPYDDGPVTRLRNCPFHRLAETHPPMVCAMNLALLQGLVEGSGVTARLDPRPGECCVVLSGAPSKNNSA